VLTFRLSCFVLALDQDSEVSSKNLEACDNINHVFAVDALDGGEMCRLVLNTFDGCSIQHCLYGSFVLDWSDWWRRLERVHREA
jgi:hypothetical protein